MNEDLLSLAKWSKFFGKVMYIMGILECITIVGAVGSVIQIILGRSLIEGADAAEAFDSRGVITDTRLKHMISNYKTFFFIQSVLTIIGIILMAITLVLYFI